MQRPITTLKDSNDWVSGIDSRSISATVNGRDDPVVSLGSYGNKTKYLWRPPTTLKDRQRLGVGKCGAKSSNSNEDFERPLPP